MLYDAFICHASEDKEGFVRPLAHKLRESHVDTWYDEFSLNVGDSLKQSIERGLSKSNYGIVILSHAFFKKKWAQTELNALFSREMLGAKQVILPVWYKISAEEVFKYSPLIADRKAILSQLGIDEICRQLIKKIRPIESPLIAAQRELISFGIEPPPLTDEWWLDAVEASNRISPWGASIPDNSIWGRWAFPLPYEGDRGENRGLRLAWTALQEKWVSRAKDEKITQISRPEQIHDFIETSPGLKEICRMYPTILAEYAPQITIKGFGGSFEADFDELSLSDPQTVPLHLDDFGGQDCAAVACNYVQGELFGSKPKFYSTFEYLTWLLSCSGHWMPVRVREYLIEGMIEWGLWLTDLPEKYRGKLPYHVEKIIDLNSIENLHIDPKMKKSLLELISFCVSELAISDSPDTLVNLFISRRLFESYIISRKERTMKRNN
jgi:hypothetical protein